MSCALWLANYGLRPLIIEQEAALGGMAGSNPYPNAWLLGRPGETGRKNAEAFARHIRQAGIETLLGARPRQLRRGNDGGFELELAPASGRTPRSVSGPALVLATGTRFRGEEWLDRVANARRLEQQGRVHLGPPWAGEGGAARGSHVAVIGGGDNAFDVSRMLAEQGVRTTIVMRSRLPRARPRLVDALLAHRSSGMAMVIAQRTVEALDDRDGKVRLRLSDGGGIEVDHVVIMFGYRPNTDQPWLAELALAMDADGYLDVDDNMETSCRGVFAVGDVVNPVHPCVATAIAAGTMAAREIQRRLAQIA
jgi:thioredoxin reductase (NADPH)